MIFKQEFDTKTSTYTYIIASAKGREAVIIDPVLEKRVCLFLQCNGLFLKGWRGVPWNVFSQGRKSNERCG